MHDDNKIKMVREHLSILSQDMDHSLGCAEESYSRLAEDASRLYEACLWAGWAAWDRDGEIPEVMEKVTQEGMSVAQAMSSLDFFPFRTAVHVRYFFNDGKFFCEGCQRNVEVGCANGCPMIPKLGIANESEE